MMAVKTIATGMPDAEIAAALHEVVSPLSGFTPMRGALMDVLQTYADEIFGYECSLGRDEVTDA